jgi:hypothetical protein
VGQEDHPHDGEGSGKSLAGHFRSLLVWVVLVDGQGGYAGRLGRFPIAFGADSRPMILSARRAR